MTAEDNERSSHNPMKDHWEHVYGQKATTELSWFQKHASTSMQLIQRTGLPATASIIDVGGGTSPLVNDLLNAGHSEVAILDLSAAALAKARHRLGQDAERVSWIEADITETELPRDTYDLWHDRAVFHFLTDPDNRQAYVSQLEHALRPGGYAVIATFAEDGPTRCSGLPVCRYSHQELAAELGERFQLLHVDYEHHQTPDGRQQSFIYCLFKQQGE